MASLPTAERWRLLNLYFGSNLRYVSLRDGAEFATTSAGYEAVTLAMIDSSSESAGEVLPEFPPRESALRLEEFFQTLYLRYEERYLFGAPDLKPVTKRLEWAATSSILNESLLGEKSRYTALDYEVRVE